MLRFPKRTLFGGGKKDIQSGFDAAKRSAIEERARKAAMVPASPSDPEVMQRPNPAPPAKPKQALDAKTKAAPAQEPVQARKSRAESRAALNPDAPRTDEKKSVQEPVQARKSRAESRGAPTSSSGQKQPVKEKQDTREKQSVEQGQIAEQKPPAKPSAKPAPAPKRALKLESEPEEKLTLVPDLTPALEPKQKLQPASKPVHLPVLTQKDLVKLRQGKKEQEKKPTPAFSQDELEKLKQRQEEHERLNSGAEVVVPVKEKEGRVKVLEEAVKRNQQKLAQFASSKELTADKLDISSKMRAIHPVVKMAASIFFALVLVVASLGAALVIVAFPATNAELIAHAHVDFPAEEIEARQIVAAEILRYVTTLPFEPVTEISMNQEDLDTLRQWSLGEYELCHLTDVRILLGSSLLLAYVLMVISIVVITLARNTTFARRSLFIAGLTCLILPTVLGFFLTFFFQPTFVIFHEIFFPQGNWQFAPETLLISTLPERYWQAAGLLWMVLFMMNGLILTALSRFCGKSPLLSVKSVTND